MKQTTWFSLFMVGVFLVTPGCEKISSALGGNWLIGTWVLDREATIEAFARNNQRDTPVGGIAGEIAAAAIRKTVDSMLKSRQNMKFTFTKTEFIESGAGGAGQSRSYEIVSRPGPDQLKVLDSDKNVRIFHREEENMWFYLTDKQKFQIYLKKIAN